MRALRTLLAIGAIIAAQSAGATTLTISSISGTWIDANPLAKISGVGTGKISWGTPHPNTNLNPSGEQSAYGFTAPIVPITADPDEEIQLGTFTHFNKTITNVPSSFLKTAELEVSIGIEGYSSPIVSVFTFRHEETNNNRKPCAYGGANGQGVNVNGCADRVVAELNAANSDTFTIGGITYTFDISGFLVKGTLLDSFLTVERKNNAAKLIGYFREVDDDTPPEPPGVVPLPASGVVLVAGLAALGALGRRKRRG